MVVDNKGTITFVQLLKEDLVIIRFVPNEGPVPEDKMKDIFKGKDSEIEKMVSLLKK